MEFYGSELRLARVFNGFTLEEVAEHIGKTRQYLHKCEAGLSNPSPELIDDLAKILRVRPEFFSHCAASVSEEQFHFRKLFTTKTHVKQVAMARGEMFVRLADQLDKLLKLPQVNVPDFGHAASVEDIENAADECRRIWGLGMGPITDMNRLAENLGILLTSFKSLSVEIDALSVATSRPIIVRNDSKESVCRQRFDIGHELGHLVLHTGLSTGDRLTESQANRFASALLIPRSMMLKLFPRPKNGRLDWQGFREFKLTWKVSKAAIFYRARQLDLLTDEQYKTGVITLRRTGEANGEHEDHLVPKEGPDLLGRSFALLANRKGMYGPEFGLKLGIEADFLDDLVGFPVPRSSETIALKRHLSLV